MDSVRKERPRGKLPLPVRVCDMANLLGLQSTTKSGTPTPFKFIPVRACDLMKQFEVEKSTKKKNVRKQLWSGKKENKRDTLTVNKRFSTAMKMTRKSTFSKPIIESIKKIYSTNDTLSKPRRETIRENKTASSFQPLASVKKVKTPVTISFIPKVVSKSKPEPKNQINDNILDFINKRFEEIYCKIDDRISKMEERIINKLENKFINWSIPITVISEPEPEINSSCHIVANQKNFQSTPEVKDLINAELVNIDANLKLKNQFSLTKTSAKTGILNSLVPTINKVKNKFEYLESKLNHGSPMSHELSTSDIESPNTPKDINWLLNEEPKLQKSSSTPVVVKSSVDMYKDMRNNVGFLCTPKNTKIASNLMTPSVVNSQKKLLSRRIQKQLMMLD